MYPRINLINEMKDLCNENCKSPKKVIENGKNSMFMNVKCGTYTQLSINQQ
jgi:hypothetical protein